MKPTADPAVNPYAIITAIVILIILGLLMWLFVFKKSDKKPESEVIFVGPSVGPSVNTIDEEIETDDQKLIKLSDDTTPVQIGDVIDDRIIGGPETTKEPEGYCIKK